MATKIQLGALHVIHNVQPFRKLSRLRLKKKSGETKEIVVPQTKDVAVTTIGMTFSPETVSHGIFV